MDKSKIICLDSETTGFSVGEDEILQLSIIDGNYRTLFNAYIRPEKITEWPEAQAVNHIAPEMVTDKPSIQHWRARLNEIFSQAEVIVGYNLPFDLSFLRAAGVNVDHDSKQYIDVMRDFAPIYGEYSQHYNSFKWQKLCTCAAYYGHQPEGNFHDSLEDAKATLFCFYEVEKSQLKQVTEVVFSAGPSRDKEAIWNHGILESPGVDYMMASLKVDGKPIELYAECGEDDIENSERFWIEEQGEKVWDENGFDQVAYPILKEEILRQAREARIPANCLKFWWDEENDLSSESEEDHLEL